MKMIEKVARVIDPDAFDPKLTHGDDCIECEDKRERVKACARAAIEAMKEPSDNLLPESNYVNLEDSRWVVKEFIDAALKE